MKMMQTRKTKIALYLFNSRKIKKQLAFANKRFIIIDIKINI